MTTQKSRRCYHRVISGLEKDPRVRFLTLTSSNESPPTCQRSWRMLYMRLQRRGLVTAYIKCPEESKNGKQHLHVLLRGSYIDQALVSAMWQEIHHAKVVDIRRAHHSRGKRALAAYMAKYMAKETAYRYSWSWEWVWKGFVKDWTKLKKIYGHYEAFGSPLPFRVLIDIWQSFLRKRKRDLFLSFLDKVTPPELQSMT